MSIYEIFHETLQDIAIIYIGIKVFKVQDFMTKTIDIVEKLSLQNLGLQKTIDGIAEIIKNIRKPKE